MHECMNEKYEKIIPHLLLMSWNFIVVVNIELLLIIFVCTLLNVITGLGCILIRVRQDR